MPTEVALRKHKCIPFLDTSKGSGTASWARIDKSTIFELNPNPQTEDRDYICDELPTTEIDHYAPELPQEIVMNANNPMYEFIFDMFYNLPVGDEAKVPCLICFPPNGNNEQKAWYIPDCVLVLGNMDTPGRKISFTLRFGGNIQRGTYTIADGVPSFTPESAEEGDKIIGAAVYNVTAPAKSGTPQSSHDSGTGYTAAIAWSPSDGSFAGSTVYKATVTLTAAAGYKFESGFGTADIQGLPATTGTNPPATAVKVTRSSNTVVKIVVTYAATAA